MSCHHRSRARRPHRLATILDALEPRRLYAAHPHQWVLHGTPDRDTIIVRPSPANPRLIEASVNGTVVGTRPASALRFLSIYAGPGDDAVSVRLDPRDHTTLLAHGGLGDDTLTGAAETDALFGDAGDDTLRGNGGPDTLVGGDGADALRAGQDRAPDLLRSDSLDPHVTFRTRTDRLHVRTVPSLLAQTQTPADSTDQQPPSASTPIDADPPIFYFPTMPIDWPPSTHFPIIDLPDLPTNYHRDVPTTAAAASIDAFGYDLYNQLRAASPDANLFFSPYSISSALAMVYAGANGQTRQQMADVLHLPLDQADFLSTFANDLSATPSPGSHADVSVSNNVWLQDGFPVLDDYLAALQSTFNATPTTLDFIHDPDASRQQINSTVSDQTHGRIPDLLPPDAIDKFTRFVLTDAVYFKDDWATPFQALPLSNGSFGPTFHPTPSQSTNAQFMWEKSFVHYTETDSLQLVEIPYAGGQYSMTIVLPKAGQDLSSISASLAPDALNSLLASAAPTDTVITLPEFSLSQTFELPDTLADMGMTDLFDPARADLSGVDGHPDLYVSRVIHKTTLDVTPSGTEATGATAVVGDFITTVYNPTPPPPPRIFIADHPFYFSIRNTQTGATLFSGTLIHPDPAT